MIKSVKLENWKAFESFDTTFSDGINFFIGKNASGKTSLLESISVGLTGSTLTVADPKMLVRGNGPAKIILEFIKGNRKYRVERLLSRQKYLGSKVFCDGLLVEQNWNNVSDYIMSLLGVTKNSFEHVLYMSEGAVFRFLTSPLKEGITKEIEETFQVDRLEGLLDEIENEQKRYRNKEATLLMEQKKLEDFTPVTANEHSDIIEQTKHLEQEFEVLRKNAADKATEVSNLRLELSRYKDIINRAEQAKSIIQRVSNTQRFDENFFDETSKVMETLKADYQNLQEESLQKSKKKGMLEEQIASLEKVCSLLHNVNKNTEDATCPVCRKKLSPDEAETICREDEAVLLAAKEEVRQLDDSLLINRNELLKKNNSLGELRSIDSSLHESISSLNIDQPNKQSLQILAEETERKLNQLTSEKANLEKQLREVDANRLATVRRLERSIVIDELKKTENFEGSLVSTAKALMALDVLRDATEQTVKAQREQRMTPVYNEMESVWKSILKEHEFEIRFDDKTIPVLYRKGQKYEANQLSGGEKMAMFIIMRTVLCRKFTSSTFMMLDEPLEHLDSNNRQLIIQFLVESFDKSWIDQLFVTTFEESVLRKFADRAQVNIVAL